MSSAAPQSARVTVDGKFFRRGLKKFYPKGVTYGPFAPNNEGEMFAPPAQTARDFQQIRELGANLIRVYYAPPRWLLDLAAQHGLMVFVDIPWPKHLCFLDSAQLRREARQAVREGMIRIQGHPAAFAVSVVNEIPAEIVRWSGPRRIERFISELVDVAKSVDGDALCTFANFPPTEFLQPEGIDFLSFNLYLHRRTSFENYLARLHTLADSKPLLLAELGMDSRGEGQQHQSDFLSWQIEDAFRNGLAGAILFSFTDDWFRGGKQVEDWAFGLTTHDRQPKPSYFAVQKAFALAPYFPLPRYPKVSVVVASYNGARTLELCLHSLERLNYPNYEVILVDDGSTDDTQQIAQRFPGIQTIHQSNHGLSAARNVGIAAATGEIVAFTDSDCRADEDWLYALVGDLLKNDWVGIGGHNFLPPDDSYVAAAVMVSPGGPAHVMLTDREAEHIPGCNMAFYRWALQEIGGFDPAFRKAGDDVDVCWRLQQNGYKLGFSPSGFVWHYRRSTVRAYLRQQNGYGEAEALLSRKHPQYFNALGGSRWAGRIYAASKSGLILQRSIIYHGLFGSGFFQRLYTPNPSYVLMLCTSVEYHTIVTVPLVAVSLLWPWAWPLALASLALSVGVCGLASLQAALPRKKCRFWSRPLVALLSFLQPIERGLARYRSQIRSHPVSNSSAKVSQQTSNTAYDVGYELAYWSGGQTERFSFLRALYFQLEQNRWHFRPDTGWSNYDLEILENRWTKLRLITTTEHLDQGHLNLRCRYQTCWTFASHALFWGVLLLDLAVAIQIGPIQPWIWMLLLTVPLVGWILEDQQTRLRRSVTDLIDEIAEQLRFVKLSETAHNKIPSDLHRPEQEAPRAHPG
ncbi:MAG TPA: glycosyltransferase [Clostridia bacterium]|nr:glycosyltransferase [Clostridia bacterium]